MIDFLLGLGPMLICLIAYAAIKVFFFGEE
jgi:hypothetical protein